MLGRPRDSLTRALISAGLQDVDGTVAALDEMAAATGAQRVGALLGYPELDFLRGDSRVKALRKRIRLPE
jgi:hypothetical protein